VKSHAAPKKQRIVKKPKPASLVVKSHAAPKKQRIAKKPKNASPVAKKNVVHVNPRLPDKVLFKITDQQALHFLLHHLFSF
jgi:hypothetical protein